MRITTDDGQTFYVPRPIRQGLAMPLCTEGPVMIATLDR